MVHAQTATAPVSPRADAPTARDGVPYLYYYPDTARLRTPIRDAGIALIYQTAREVDDGRLKYGDVTLQPSVLDGVLETLGLTLVVDTNDWDAISAWMREIFVRMIEWEAGLSEEQRKDFSERVHFTYLPAIYDHAPA